MPYGSAQIAGAGRGGTITAFMEPDGVVARCAPAGYEGRYCAVCAKTYDYDEPDAQAMVECDKCGLWVHPQCDGMSQADYLAFEQNLPGFENYECPDCRRNCEEHIPSLWRQIERLVTASK